MVFEYSLRTVKDAKGNERGAITICYDESSVPSDKIIKIDDIVRGQGILVQEYFKDNEGKEWSYILIANDNDDEVLKGIFENLSNGLKQIDITLVEAV